MSLTYNQAIDEILTVFKNAWPLSDTTVKYDDVANDSNPPPVDSPWARVILRHTTGRQATLANAQGQSRFRREGILTVSVFVKRGFGLPRSPDLATIVRDAFEGKSSPGGVWFRNVRIVEVGADGSWFIKNVVVEFTYDEIK